METAYTIETFDPSGVVSFHQIPDPFVHHTIGPSGWRGRLAAAWWALTGQLEYRVLISADRRRIEEVLQLNPDYLGPAGSPSRKAWDAQLNEALGRLVRER